MLEVQNKQLRVTSNSYGEDFVEITIADSGPGIKRKLPTGYSIPSPAASQVAWGHGISFHDPISKERSR